MSMKKSITELVEKIGGVSDDDYGLMSKKGRLNSNAVSEAKDVLGFDYVLHYNNSCYECYTANPPLIGSTQPVPIPCPLGIEMITDYKIDYKKAIDIFHTGDWGGKFTSIALSKPLHPDVNEPYWYFRSDLGVQIIIGANSGEVIHPK